MGSIRNITDYFVQEALEEAAATIDNLKMELANQIRLYQTQTEELKYLTIQLLDVDMEKLQDTISEKDKAIAVLEMQSLSPQCYLTGQRSPTEVLHCERQKLMQELKNKVIYILHSMMLHDVT